MSKRNLPSGDDDDDFAFLFGGAPTPTTKKPQSKPTTKPAPSLTDKSIKKTKPNKVSQNEDTNAHNESNKVVNKPSTKSLIKSSQQQDQTKPLLPLTPSQQLDILQQNYSKVLKKEQEEKDNSIGKKPHQQSFSQLGISSWLITTLSKLKIIIPTDIQYKTIPSVLLGNNIIARAKTGSGKTAAFALPILENLSHDPYGIYALVLTPTRELAIQIKEQFDIFGTPISLNTVCVIGGVDMIKQAQELESRPHVVIATPGRLSDLLVRGSITNVGAKHLKYLVLDEADRLFDQCFTPFLDTILDYLPPVEERQTILVSATLTIDLLRQHINHPLYQRIVLNPVYHAAAEDDDNVVSNLTQSFCFFPLAIKEAYINYLLQFANLDVLSGKINLNAAMNHLDDADIDADHKSLTGKKRNKKQNQDAHLAEANATANEETHAKQKLANVPHPTKHHQSCIVFTKTVKTAQFLHLFLTEMNISNVPLHSQVKQSQRIANLNKFRSGQARVLVATDIAARGLDIPLVTLVINYDLPHTYQDYIHRVGRTARANRHGIALTLVTQYDVAKLQQLEEGVGIKLTEFTISEENVIQPLKVVNEKKKYAQVILEEQLEKEAERKAHQQQ